MLDFEFGSGDQAGGGAKAVTIEAQTRRIVWHVEFRSRQRHDRSPAFKGGRRTGSTRAIAITGEVEQQPCIFPGRMVGDPARAVQGDGGVAATDEPKIARCC